MTAYSLPHRAASRAELVQVLGRCRTDTEVRAGRLIRVLPHAYTTCAEVDDVELRECAALISLAPNAVLRGPSALRRHGVEPFDGWPTDDVHVGVPHGRRPAARAGVRLLRSCRPVPAATMHGMTIETAPSAAVTAWPLSVPLQRELVIRTAAQRPSNIATMRALASDRSSLPGRARLIALLDLLASGCQSELEIWGLLHVFDHPALRHGQRQLVVQAGGRNHRLDLAFVAQRVAVELDGRTYHAQAGQWERDRQRDSALAAQGWLVLRFSYERLTREPDACRNELLAVLALRTRT